MSLCYVSLIGKKRLNYNRLKKIFFSFLPQHIKIHLDDRYRTIIMVQAIKFPSVIGFFFLSPWIV